jgi:hypothetical protein
MCVLCVCIRANSLNKAVNNDDSFNYTFLDCYLHTKKKKTFAFPIVDVHKDLSTPLLFRRPDQLPNPQMHVPSSRPEKCTDGNR